MYGSGSTIKQYEYSSSNNSLRWRIVKRTGGSYTIAPKSGESNNMVLSVHNSEDSNGTDLVQYSYINDTNYKDEWIIRNELNYTLLGVPDVGHDHTTCLTYSKSQLDYYGYIPSSVLTQQSVIDCLTSIANSNTFAMRAHGDGSGNVWISEYHTLDAGDINALPNDAFSNEKLICFIACQSALGGPNAINVTAAAFSRNARAVIGFEDEIICSTANKWTKEFFKSLCEDKTLEESVDIAINSLGFFKGGLDSIIVLCDDQDFTLNY